jgi:hypothetical protein
MDDVDRLVLNTVNAPWRRRIGAVSLVGCLREGAGLQRWSEHVRTFFEDVPREAMLRFMVAHRLAPGTVLETYRTVMGSEAADAGLEAWLTELAAAA